MVEEVPPFSASFAKRGLLLDISGWSKYDLLLNHPGGSSEK
jgi:hypothetical protein